MSDNIRKYITLDEVPTPEPPDLSGIMNKIDAFESNINDLLNRISILESNTGNNKPSDYVVLKDISTGYEYIGSVNNGEFNVTMRTMNVYIENMPNKTDYTDNELFDPTGMVIIAELHDGSKKEITDYTYNECVLIGSDNHQILYTDEIGTLYTMTVPITTRTLENALADFEYTTNGDGTYTITGWKGTLNGQQSTEIIIPNSPLVVVEVPYYEEEDPGMPE